MAPSKMTVSLAACGVVSFILSHSCFTAPAASSRGVTQQAQSKIFGDDERVSSAEGSGAGPIAWVSVSAAAVLGLAAAVSKTARTRKVSMKYTTKRILPAMQWITTNMDATELKKGEFMTKEFAGCDICFGRTEGGKLFAVGDKAPPTGISFSVGGDLAGEELCEAQYGNKFNVFTGQPTGEWCPSPPIIGKLIAGFMGDDAQAVATFDIRESGFFGGGEIEINVDTNAKAAYEADYWKGLLDAQGKADGTYY